jgi:4-diphosphocytidyl-2-C-methyl-D-erythritol kinase
VTLKAHAKVNLDLRVGARRADGYHEVRTVFHAIGLHDTILIEKTPREPLTIVGDAADMPLGEENLAWKAAAALWRASGRQGTPTGARIAIRKRIPTQAGLGGGSSDAAATLIGLNHIWREPMSPRALLPLAATLGADVPFFLVGGTALGLGRGDEIYPLIEFPSHHLVVVLPAFGVSTKEAYEWLSSARFEDAVEDRANLARPSDDGFVNDFERVVEARHADVRDIREQLKRAGANVARMSGSGSAVFGAFSTAAGARRAAARLRRPGWMVLITRSAGRTRKQKDFAEKLLSARLCPGTPHLSRRLQIS